MVDTPRKRSVTLAVSGGVAAYKACELARLLIKAELAVDVVMTRSAQRFVGPLLFEALTGRPVVTDDNIGVERAYAHLDLGQKSDLVLVVPATANVIGKMAHGIADDELTTMLLAATVPILLAPAMNTGMWSNPIVQRNLDLLRQLRRVTIVQPSAGELACGAFGPGRLADVSVIAEQVFAALAPPTLAGLRVLITAGPTWEALDPVRVLSNRSTGRMGYELARVARQRGAQVTLVSGPVALAAPSGVELIAVESAAEMARAVFERVANVDLAVMSAAVADYRPARPAEEKLKKGEGLLTLTLERTTDILASVGALETRPILVGFAAESERLLEHAGEKLQRKGADFIIANLVGRERGFGAVASELTILEREAEPTTLASAPKSRLAEQIWDRLAASARVRQALAQRSAEESRRGEGA